MSSLLEVNNMTHFFGGLRAVHGFNLRIEPGQIHGLIGPNGAGKTTVFNLITGVYTPTEGTLTLEGEKYPGQGTASHRLNGNRQNLSEPAPLAAHERAGSYPAGPLFPAQLRPVRGLFRHPGLPTTGKKSQGALLPADGDL